MAINVAVPKCSGCTPACPATGLGSRPNEVPSAADADAPDSSMPMAAHLVIKRFSKTVY
ncbi:hypothetical protein [Cupriavidus basilensis]|uniref:hypothetical protein n=1 Tax=Cupriavidus basilensis TaxID=68895 RepID=UPI001300BF8B|nr:hypothetical protein [Cupriavidus basilensis]